MTRPIDPSEVLCKDGGSFSVHRMGGRIAIFASFRDRLAVDAGLARYTTFHEPGDACAEHAGMPVEVIREYARLHGGVAQAGEKALALLKELASEAGAPAAVPPAVETPIPDSRPSIADLVAAGTHDFLGRPLTAAQLALDCLTPAVIEAKRGLSEVEGPLVLGLGHAEASPRLAALERRAEIASLSGRGLCLLDHPRYQAHPLRGEAIKLRERLAEVRKQTLAEIAREA